jgi:hypothetical protein
MWALHKHLKSCTPDSKKRPYRLQVGDIIDKRGNPVLFNFSGPRGFTLGMIRVGGRTMVDDAAKPTFAPALQTDEALPQHEELTVPGGSSVRVAETAEDHEDSDRSAKQGDCGTDSDAEEAEGEGTDEDEEESEKGDSGVVGLDEDFIAFESASDDEEAQAASVAQQAGPPTGETSLLFGLL